MANIIRVDGPVCNFLHGDQGRDGNDPYEKTRTEFLLRGRLVLAVEIERFGHEYIQGCFPVPVAVEIEHHHAFLGYPSLPLCSIRELFGCHRHSRLVAEGCQGLECWNDVIRTQLDYEVNVVREPQVAMRVHGKPPSQKITHACVFQSGDQGLEAREFHDAAIIFVYI